VRRGLQTFSSDFGVDMINIAQKQDRLRSLDRDRGAVTANPRIVVTPPAEASSRSLCALEQLDRIAIWILHLDLPADWAGFHLVAEMEAGLLHRGNTLRKIGDIKHHTVPPTRFLMLPIRHRPRSGGLGPAEQKMCVAERDTRDLG
jgi:hypothetical protein